MITEQEVFNKLKEVLTKDFQINAEQITLNARLSDDLDIDSIDAIDMIVALQPFMGNKTVKPTDFKSVVTVGNLVSVITRLMNE